jgi:dephospho-CoA kinase
LQLCQDEKARRADYVVRNDGSLEQLELAVEAVLGELRK